MIDKNMDKNKDNKLVKNVDENLVKKVMTFKAGNFVFSSKLSLKKLVELEVKVDVLCEMVEDLPVLPLWASKLNVELIRKSIFSNAAIEGNPLTEEKVEAFLTQKEGSEKVKQAELEILNLKNVYEYVRTITMGGSAYELTEDLIKKLHSMITKDLKHEYNVPGSYRDHDVKVSNKKHGGVYIPPKILPDIEKLMKEFILWINSKEVIETTPAVRAALAHYHLSLIHPFADGNGRTARVVEAIILRSAGIKYAPVMLSNYYYRNIDAYYWAFSLARKNKDFDVTPFVEFVLKGLVESLYDIKSRITHYIIYFMLRDFYLFGRKNKMITQRQFDLLNLLLNLDKPLTFNLSDLFQKPLLNVLYKEGQVSERTARRDLKKLTDQALLVRSEDRSYELNLKALG